MTVYYEKFVIERLIDDNIDDDGNQLFLIRWLGYDDSHNLWIDQSQINEPQMIKDYWSHVNRKKQKRKEKNKIIENEMNVGKSDSEINQGRTLMPSTIPSSLHSPSLKIVNVKDTRRGKQYLVKSQEDLSSVGTWLPADEVQDLLADFLK